MLSPSTSQHIHAADFVRPRPFSEFVQKNKDRLNALKRNWPYGSKFSEVLHVVREVQAHHQRLPLHEASDYDHEEGAMHSALDLANEALVLLKGIPVHIDLPLVKREEQKERVFFSIVLCALFSNIADGDVRYRIDGFDADDNRTTKTPCLPLARFFEKDHVRVRLWKKTEPDFHLYQSYASRILHEAGKKILDKIPDHEFSSLYGFVCAFVENRMKDAQSLDPVLFDCLLRAKKKISDRNHLLNSGYLDDRTAPTLKRELSLILSELFKNEWSIDTGGALRNSMVLFHAGKVYLRYPEAFSHIEERLDSRWADSHISINPKKILSYMTKSRMVEQESNSLMIKLKFVEEPELPVQKTKAVTVQADAVALSNPSRYLAEGTKTREYHDQDRVKNNLSRLVKEKIQYGEKDLSGLEQETCIAEYDISSNRSSDKQTERSKGFSKLFDAILPVLKKDADSKSKINKDSEPKSPAELAVIKAKRSRKDSLVNQKTEEIKTQLSDENVYPYADKKAAATKPAPVAQASTRSEETEVVPPSPKKPSRDAAMFSTEQDSIAGESSNGAADRATEVNSSEPAGISLGSRLKGFGRSFTSKFQGVVASIKKVKIFEFSKEPSLSVPTGDNVSAEDGIYYVAPTKAASKDKVSSTEEIMASSAEPTVHEAPENSSETKVSPVSMKEAEPLKQATVSIDSSSIANLSEKAELSQPLTETEKNFSSEEDSVHSTQEQTGSLGSQKSLEPKSPETSTAGQENSASADSLEPSKESLTSLVATEVSSAESSVEDHSKSSNTPASTVEEATEQTVRKQSDQPSQNKAKTEEIRPKAEVLPSELSKSSASSKDVSPKGAISSEFKEEQKENVKAAKASKDVKPVSGSCSLEGSAKTANNNGVEDSSGSSPNNKQSKEQTAQLKTSSTKEKNSNKSSSEAKKSSRQENTKQVPTTSATTKNASPNKSAKTNKAENAASTGTEKLSTHNKNQKQSALPATSSTAKSKPISSEGTNSEGQTRTDIRNEAVKQHNKEKAAAARKENKRVNDILAVAGKPKEELQGLTPITGAKKSKIESVASSSASNEASKQKKTESQLSSSTKKNQPKASSSKTSVSSKKGKVSTSTVNKKKAGEEKITSGDKDLSSQKLSTQKKTIKTSSPEKSSPQKTPTQKPTTEEKATENSPTGSHSPQKSSSAKKTNASQKVANQVSPSSLSPAENLSSQQESSPEQKPSSKEHLLSRETVSAESASPSPASCTSSPTIPAGDRAPTQKKASPTQEGASTENISPGEEVSPEKQSSPAKRILTSTSLSSEDEPALVEPVPTAFINSNKEEKKTSAEEKTLKETTLGEKDPEKPLAEKSAAKKIAEEKTPSQENSSPEVLPTSLEGNSTVGEVLLLLSPLFKEEHTAGVGLPISSEEAKLLSPSYLLSLSLEESSRAGEQEEVCNTQTQKEEKPSSRTDIVSDKNAVKKKFICPQDTELQLPSKPLLLCAPASVSIAKQKSVLDSQKAEVESDSDKISLEEGLAQLFSMDVKDFFSEDSEAKANLSRPAKRQSSAPAVAKAIKEFISDPNNPLVAKGAQFIYSVSDDEISDDAELRSNRSAKAVSSKVQPGSTSGSNKLPEGACKVKHPSAKTSVAPTLGDQCVITRTHMFGSSSAGREYQSGILTIRADVVKLTNPENKEPDKQHTGKKTRAQKINEAQLATIRGQAKKEVRGKAQKPGLKHGKKSEPPAPLPSKISHLGVSLFVSRFGLK